MKNFPSMWFTFSFFRQFFDEEMFNISGVQFLILIEILFMFIHIILF